MSLKRLYAIDIPVLITLGNKIYPPGYTSRIIICNTETILKLANVVKILVPAAKISTCPCMNIRMCCLKDTNEFLAATLQWTHSFPVSKKILCWSTVKRIPEWASGLSCFHFSAPGYRESRWKKQLETFWSVFNKHFHQAQLHRPSLAAKFLSLEIYIKD